HSSFDDTKLNDGMTYQLGFGYAFTDWLRADLTLDGFRTRFNGSHTSAAPCSTDVAYAGTTCREEASQKAGVLSLMANGYVDLGTYAGFTPYAGAGAGVSLVSWSKLDDSSYCV